MIDINNGVDMSETNRFNIGERVVYPSHGVGEVLNIEKQLIGQIEIEVYVISFPHEKMTLKVPLNRAEQSGLRKISHVTDIEQIYDILESKPKELKGMWSKRAKDYGEKINSGDINAIAEVVRDLYKNIHTDRSYSERAIYEIALNRLATELAILQGLNYDDVVNQLTEILKEKIAA